MMIRGSLGKALLGSKGRGRGPKEPIGPQYIFNPANNIVVGVGDSITVASHNTAGGGITYDSSCQPRLQNTSGSVGGFLTWASILVGDGRIRFSGVHATGGLSAAQIKTTHIDGSDSPLNDDPKPGICVVLAGANDLAPIDTGSITVAQVVASIESIWTSLIGAGILPVACGVCSHGNTALYDDSVALNAAIQASAARFRIPFVDLLPVTGNASGWFANYNVDAPHPSVLGAKAMGWELAKLLRTLTLAPAPLVTVATEAASDLLYLNGPCQRQGATSGVPSGGANDSTTYWSWTANGTTPTLEVRTGYDGKAWVWDKTSDASGDTSASGTGAGGGVMTLVDGHLYEVGLIMEVESWVQDDMLFEFVLVKITDGTKVPLRFSLRRDAFYSGIVGPFKFVRTFRCNATNAPAGGYRFTVTLGDGATTTNATGKVALGQITLRDLGVG